MESYLTAYVERDVREVLRVTDLSAFQRFVQLCAGRSGQLLNYSSLASDCGITHPTARHWLSVLEASSIIHILQPFHENFSKRLVKSPKLYFIDTGLMCRLLRIRDVGDLVGHPLYGSIFETFVFSEIVKAFTHLGQRPPIHFWHDHSGREVDVVLESGKHLTALEVKSGKTVSSDFFTGLGYFKKLARQRAEAVLIYGGDDSHLREGVRVRTWWQIS